MKENKYFDIIFEKYFIPPIPQWPTKYVWYEVFNLFPERD